MYVHAMPCVYCHVYQTVAVQLRLAKSALRASDFDVVVGLVDDLRSTAARADRWASQRRRTGAANTTDGDAHVVVDGGMWDEVWTLAAELAGREDYHDVTARRRLLAFAITQCPDDHVSKLLAEWQRLSSRRSACCATALSLANGAAVTFSVPQLRRAFGTTGNVVDMLQRVAASTPVTAAPHTMAGYVPTYP